MTEGETGEGSGKGGRQLIISDGKPVSEVDQAWFQIRRWVETNVERTSTTRMGLSRTAYVPMTQLAKLFGDGESGWPAPKYARRLVHAFLIDPPDAVVHAMQVVTGENATSEPAGTSARTEIASQVTPPTIIHGARTLGDWLTYAAAVSRKSDQELAAFVGVPAMRVTRWRKGRSDVGDFPEIEQLQRIAEICGLAAPEVDLWSILPDGPDEAPKPLSAEIEDWAMRLATVAYAPESVARNAKVFAARFITTERAEATLQAIATPLGVTRERVRQIVDKMLQQKGLVKPRTFALQRLLDGMMEIVPISESEADERLAHLLGPGMGTAAALRYAKDALQVESPFEWQERRGAERALVIAGTLNWWAQVRSLARRMIRVRGAAHLPSVYVETLRTVGSPVALADVVAALQRARGFEWLDEGDWFWFGVDDGPNHLITSAQGILETAEARLDIEVIQTGLLRNRQRLAAHSSIFSVHVPAAVLSAVLQRSGRFTCVQADDFELTAPRDDGVSDEAADETVARVVVAELKRLGGIAARIELRETLVDTGAVGWVSLAVALATSPLIAQVQRGVFAVRGWPINPERLAEAERKVGGENRVSRTLRVDAATGRVSWDVPVTAAMLNRSVVYLVAGTQGLIPPGSYTGPNHTVLDVTEHRIAGVATVMRSIGAKPDDVLRIEVDPKARSVAFEVVPGAPSADGSRGSVGLAQ